MEYKKFLPMGTVVSLKSGAHKIMITGFCIKESVESKKVYDYSGALYPQGNSDLKSLYLFNHNDIKEVYALGYVDENEKSFKQMLEKFASEHIDVNGFFKK